MKMKRLAVLAAALVMTTVPVTTQAEVTYEEEDSGTNIGQSFTGSATVTFGQTPSFTVKIPKTITLDDEGAGKYTVGVKGQIPSKYAVSVVPDSSVLMEEENGLLDDITADVTAGKTEWKASELSEDSYAESTNNTIQMQSIDYGKFEGTLNFNVSAKIPVELKDASDEVKAGNSYVGETSFDSLEQNGGNMVMPSSIFTVKVGDIIYIVGGERTISYGTEVTGTLSTGYYRCTKETAAIPSSPKVGISIIDMTSKSLLDVEYLGESYIV